MNKENFNQLKDSLYAQGFEILINNVELENCFEEEPARFRLSASKYFDEWTRTDAKLYFRRSPQLNCHFLYSFTATLHYLTAARNSRTHMFYTHPGLCFSFIEAYNLLDGRCVYKKGVDIDNAVCNAWIRLDFDKRDMEGNYNLKPYRERNGDYLEKALQLYPIEELTDEAQRRDLILSLRRGDVHAVSFVKDSKKEIKYIEANPLHRMINIYSSQQVLQQRKIGLKEI